MVKFETVSKQTLADVVYEKLHEAIMRGDYADGEELNQVGLAEQFGVSRVPIREALWRLEAERMVVASPQQRFRVVEMTPQSVLELADIREMLEVYALSKRVGHYSEEEIEELRRAANVMAKTKDKEDWLMADRQFHRLINGVNTPVAIMIDGVRSQIHRYLQVVVSSEERRKEAREEHTALLDAIEAGNVRSAEKILRHHISGTRKILQKHL
ncbi:MAG: GntR family transcriptional regulator [Halieaceae bacterium]|nr:GntR family transcriptional regulator [Halieaceae bacterium]